MRAPEPAALHEMERNMRLNEDILRYLTVREEALSKGPSAQMRTDRGDDETPRFERKTEEAA